MSDNPMRNEEDKEKENPDSGAKRSIETTASEGAKKRVKFSDFDEQSSVSTGHSKEFIISKTLLDIVVRGEYKALEVSMEKILPIIINNPKEHRLTEEGKKLIRAIFFSAYTLIKNDKLDINKEISLKKIFKEIFCYSLGHVPQEGFVTIKEVIEDKFTLKYHNKNFIQLRVLVSEALLESKEALKQVFNPKAGTLLVLHM